jgi:RND family efflux transporter MFP subunit
MKFKFPRIRSKLKLKAAAISIGVAICVGTLWVTLHLHAQNLATPEGATIRTVGVATVTRNDLFKQVTISAEFRPYEEVELHAKVSGYVKDIDVDFGDRVKAGQLLATLEAPELQAELINAQAEELKADADYTNANLIFSRLVAVNKEHPNLIAEQELDTAEANAHTTAAVIAATKANVEKYQTLIAYTRITAPFDGVVTRRYADPGAVIEAGTSSETQAKSLVRVSDNYRLRLDFPVTVDYVQDIKLGDPVEVKVDSLNGKMLTGKISRFSQDVDDNTRTMMTEIEIPNPNLELMPGMYATVILKVEKHAGVLVIPTEAVFGEKSSTVFVVNADHKLEQRTIKLGMEMPDKYEVLSGLHEGDVVVVGNHSGLQNDEKVEPQSLPPSMPE